MKLLFRLSLTILSLLLVLIAAYLALPLLLTQAAHYQLTQQGFSDIEIKIGPVGLQSATIEHAQMSNQSLKFKLTDLRIEYQLAELLSGTADTIDIENITLIQLSEIEREKTNTLPSPETLAGLLSLTWHELIPARSLKIKSMSIYATDETPALSASGEITRDEQNISGKFSLMDRSGRPHQISLDISPETGIKLQLISDQSKPLSVNLKTLSGANGLAGSLRLDLTQISELIGLSANFTGLLQAELSYYSETGSKNTNFAISTSGQQLGFYDMQILDMQSQIEGSIAQQGSHFQVQFLDTSRLTLQGLQQGENTLENLRLELPRSLSIIDGEMLISNSQGASITLLNLVVDNIHISEAQLDKITLSTLIATSPPDLCKFTMQLTTPLVEMGEIRLRPDPVQIEGVCPDLKEFKWLLDTKTQNISYEDTDYRLSLKDCAMSIGNSEHGKLLDENPAELGGQLSCNIDKPGGELRTRFRFNPANSAGHARFSVSDIELDDEHPLFSSVLINWAQPFELVSGELSVQGAYRWWKNSKGLDRSNLTMDLQLSDAGGYYEGVLFSGLNYQDSFKLLPELNSSEFSPLSIDHIDIAIPIHHASAKIRFKQAKEGPLPLLEINDLTLSLLDGQVKGDELEVDLNADRQSLLFGVEGLDLTQIVDLQQLDGLAASGRLNGTVPVTITPKGVKITEGRITAQDPGGHIQYIPAGNAAESGKSVPGTELVLNILEDLSYDSLNVDVDYDEDGEIRMKLAIKGKSPQVDANRPIHFNLTLEQNLLTLLKGLRYAEGINNEIDKSVQKYFSEQKKSVN